MPYLIDQTQQLTDIYIGAESRAIRDQRWKLLEYAKAHTRYPN